MKRYFGGRKSRRVPVPASGSEHRVCECGREFTVASSKSRKRWCTETCYTRQYRKRAS